MATGGVIEEDSVEKMKNSYPTDLRYNEDYQTSPESSEGLRARGMSSDEDEDEISVGCPSPAPERLTGSDEDVGRRPESPLMCRNYQEERSSGDEQEQSDERTSSLSSASTTIHCRRTSQTCSSEDDQEHREDEYFKPLKKLKMMQIDKVSYSINRTKSTKRIHRPYQSHSPKESTSTVRRQSLEDSSSSNGVKSFSILDILNHRPSKGAVRSEEPRDTIVPTGIVRPWDYGSLEDPGASCIPPPAHRGLIPPPPPLLLERYHRVHQHLRPKSADFCSSYDTSTCSSSGRSSTGGSDCCTSPDILNCTVSPGPAQRRPSQPAPRKGAKQQGNSPLDALFQLTSKTFEELNGEAGSGTSSSDFS